MRRNHLSNRILLLALLVVWKGAPTVLGQVDPEEYRPVYHLDMPGDPSGTLRYNGLFHIFTWDHMTSTDLVHWTSAGWPFQSGPANIGYWTGSVVIDHPASSGWGSTSTPAMVAIYTAHDNNDPKEDIRISVSTDHQDFIYYGGNPVINTPDILFRDPHVFWHEETDRWIMAVARSSERIIRFYASPDLKNWAQISEFGPLGGRQEIWEVPGLVRLPVQGQDTHKWALFCGMGPNREQYYVGDFDGTNFFPEATAYAHFSEAAGMDGLLFADFEADTWAELGWTTTGNAFGTGPSAEWSGQPVSGFVGQRLASSYVDGDWLVGSTLVSPSFTITKKFINFLIGGGNHPGQTCINLLVDSLVVRSATGESSDIMKWQGWDVTPWLGQTAQIQIVDTYGGFWGRVYVDHIMFSDTLFNTKREHAKWIDWGSDFYGGRVFEDYDGTESHATWMGWMGNWAYATNVPTPWQGGGGQSLPRILELEPGPGGYQIIQHPSPRLKQLRGAPVHAGPRRVENAMYLSEFHPAVNAYELEVVFNLNGGEQNFGVNLCVGSASTNGFQKVIVGYDARTQNLYLDRRFSGEVDFHPAFPSIEYAPFPTAEGHIKFQIFVDKSSIEVFVNDGKRVFTSLIFPHPENRAIEVFSENGPTTMRSFAAWPLSSIW